MLIEGKLEIKKEQNYFAELVYFVDDENLEMILNKFVGKKVKINIEEI